ncbi:MAG: enoyl-CoA hydratase/isomerase family protein, partial [Bryobacteraceae bacterium]|nr:enoyl-CoA hydratase/isomerase family protein [Bryobacteraceae bacterium]
MSSLLVNREDRVLRLTLNRPDKRNALSADLCRDLVARIEEAERDPQIGCILLDAAGPIFCAGMDLDEALAPNAPDQTAIHEP